MGRLWVHEVGSAVLIDVALCGSPSSVASLWTLNGPRSATSSCCSATSSYPSATSVYLSATSAN